MTIERERIQAEALDWVIATGDPKFDRWAEFTTWLERSSAHADAYHHVMGAVADSEPALMEFGDQQPVEHEAESRPRLRLAVAASIAVFAAAGALMLAPALTTDSYRTVPGQVRTIALGEGNQVTLNGDTRVELAGFDRREVRLKHGQIYLRLEGRDEVEVLAGDLRLIDVGTAFDVTREGRDTRVAVDEGMVVADPKGAAVRIGAGQMMEARDGAGSLATRSSGGVRSGSWIEGQLSYADAPISAVLEDLRRSTGLVFSPSAAMSAHRFSGTLSVADIRANPQMLEPLLGVSVRKSGERWVVGEVD